MLEMPNSFSEEPEKIERYTAIRVRDARTGKFVAGPNPHLVAKAFRRRPDPWATASTYVPPGSPTELIKHPNPSPPKKKFPKGKAAAVTGAALAVGGGAAAYSRVNKGWGADSAARATNVARKTAMKAPKAPKSDARHEHYLRAWRKFTNLQERSNSGKKISPMRSRSFAPLENQLPGYGGRTGSNWEFNGNKRVRKSWKSGAQMVGASVAGGVVANQLPQTSGKALKKTLKKIKER